MNQLPNRFYCRVLDRKSDDNGLIGRPIMGADKGCTRDIERRSGIDKFTFTHKVKLGLRVHEALD